MALWSLPDFDTLLQDIRETARALRTALGTAPDTGPGSDVDIDSQTWATMEHRLHRYVRLGVAMLFPQSASGNGTQGWAVEMGLSDGQSGYGKILPDVSSATDGLACTATGATGDIQNLTLLDTAGLQYKVDESYSFPGATTTNVDIVSVSTGLATRLPVGSVLTFESPIANLSENATIVVALDGGVDAEEDPDANARVLDRWRAPSLSGNNVQWKRWIEDTDAGVYDGWVWPKRYGYDPGPPVINGVLGTVDYAATERDSSRADRVISAGQVTAITANVDASAAIDLMNNSRHVTLTTQAVGGTHKIELHPGASSSASPDFDSYTLNTTIAAWTVAGAWAGWIRATAPIDAVISVGDYVIINSARAQVAAVGAGSTGGANTDFDVTTSFLTYDATINPWPWTAGYDPTITPDRLTSGGGVIEAAHAAVIAYYDSLGPAKGTYFASDDTSWDDTYRHKLAQSACVRADTTNILDVTTTPTSDTIPTDPGGATTPLIIPGELIIEVIP